MISGLKAPCPYRRPTWSVESEPLEYEMIVSINVNMAQENNVSETATERQAKEHKGSGVAVPSARWYIAECKPTRERTIREMLKKVGYEVYVASQRERIAKGKFIETLIPLIPGVVQGRSVDNLRIQIDKAWKTLKRTLKYK